MTAEPDSSMLWIRYVAYLLSTGDVAAARAVAERALSTINYRHAPPSAGCRSAHWQYKAKQEAKVRRAIWSACRALFLSMRSSKLMRECFADPEFACVQWCTLGGITQVVNEAYFATAGGRRTSSMSGWRT